MQPDLGDVHVNAPLTNVSISYSNKMEDYVADKVFPLVYVKNKADIYIVYDRGFFFADEGTAMLRSPGTNAAETGYQITATNTYTAVNYAIACVIPDELRANADSIHNLDRNATELVTQIQMIRRERAFAADFMTTGTWTTDTSVTNKWSDYGASDPFTDIEDGLDTVQGLTGRRPNKFVMGQIVWRRLKHHPDFIDRIKGGATANAPAMMTKQMLAAMVEVDEVLVGQASYRSSAEGASLTLARIIDDDFLMLYTPTSPSMLEPAAGYTFIWETAVAGRRGPLYVRKIREERPRRDVIEAHCYFDQVATSAQSGNFFSDCVD